MYWCDVIGFFEYCLSNKVFEVGVLWIMYFKGDVGRQFLILLNNELLVDVLLLVGEFEMDFYMVDYLLSLDMCKVNVFILCFSVVFGFVVGGIYGICLLKDLN